MQPIGHKRNAFVDCTCCSWRFVGELIVGWRTAAARGVLSNICALRGVTLEFQDAFNLDCVLVGALQQE